MPVRRSDDVTYEVVQDRAVLVDPQGTELITLNPVGTLVWEALDGRREPDDIASHVLPRLTGVALEDLRGDVAVFLSELHTAGLVMEAPGPTG